jgi:signal transduction histidine kinase
MRIVRPFVESETYRVLLFLASGIVLGTLSVTLLITGWGLAFGFAITPLVVPLIIAIGGATRLLAAVERFLAGNLIGLEVRAPERYLRAQGFWSRAATVLRDRWLWKAQAYLVLRLLVALPLMALISWSIELMLAPITDDFGFLGLGEFGPVAIGVLGLLLAIRLAPLHEAPSRRLAQRLLDGAGPPPLAPAALVAARRRALAIHTAASVGASLVLVVIWALTPHSSFWPIWVLLPLGLALAIHSWVDLVLDGPRRLRPAGDAPLALHLGISGAVALFLIGVWAAASRGYFWPIWPILALALAAGAHTAVVLATRSRRAELEERIDVLETTRAGAVDVQEAELRRIERDLHDGAQARLVALGMSLGMAEQKLAADPDAARALLAEAQHGAREALEELRGLARGIHPPVLSDRGLEAAVSALAERSPLRATLSVEISERPPAAVETAAYFVVAEALANAGKHSGASHVEIRIRRTNDLLAVAVADNGRGGADPAGGGLTGLRRRVEALDGTLRVSSPEGRGTTVRAELPCAS